MNNIAKRIIVELNLIIYYLLYYVLYYISFSGRLDFGRFVFHNFIFFGATMMVEKIEGGGYDTIERRIMIS